MGKRISKRTRQLLNILFLLLLVAVTVVVLFTATDIKLGDIKNFLVGCDPKWIVAAFAAMLGFVLFEAVSLHFILRGLGERPRIASSIAFSAADTYYSAITPSASGGQPAAAFYMVKSGVGAGKASFALVFNLAAYTLSIIVIGFVALAVRPAFFSLTDGWFPKVLIIVGFVVQGLLLAFFIGCMFWGSAVKKLGHGIISLLSKTRIVKQTEKWRGRLDREVDKYKDCLSEIKHHPCMTLVNFLCNLGQRTCHVLIPCFVLLAADSTVNFFDLFACSALVTIGYNSIPLPGGVGVYEYLYPNIYCIVFPSEAFVLSALMVSRAISYYICMMLSGAYTLGYHAYLLHRMGKKEFEKETETEKEIAAPTEENEGEHSEGSEQTKENGEDFHEGRREAPRGGTYRAMKRSRMRPRSSADGGSPSSVTITTA